MEVYGFLNTFFVASILISSILVVVLVYHFRQRLGAMEEKTETLLQIVNNVVQKLNHDESDNGIQNIVPLSNVNSDEYYGEAEEYREMEYPNESEKNEDDEESEEGDEESQEDDEESQEGDEESQEGDEESQEDDEESQEDDEESQEGDEESQEGEDIEEPQESAVQEDDVEDSDDKEGEVKRQVTEEIESLKKEDITKEYEKMNVAQLKQMVKDRNLSNAVSKMKKPDLVSLLINE